MHSHTAVETRKSLFRGKPAQLFPFSARWSHGGHPELDVNLPALHWFSSALQAWCIETLRLDISERSHWALPPSMFYAPRDRGRTFLRDKAASLFSCHAYFIIFLLSGQDPLDWTALWSGGVCAWRERTQHNMDKDTQIWHFIFDNLTFYFIFQVVNVLSAQFWVTATFPLFSLVISVLFTPTHSLTKAAEDCTGVSLHNSTQAHSHSAVICSGLKYVTLICVCIHSLHIQA